MNTKSSAGIVGQLILFFVLMVMASAYADCSPAPSGLVGWWQAESNYINAVDGNSGTPVGTSFDQGKVGSGFVFGNTGPVVVGNPVSMQLQDFTIEAWVKRTSASLATVDPGNVYGSIVGWGDGGYVLNMVNGGQFGIKKSGVADIFAEGVLSSALIVSDTNFHHIAVSKVGSNVVFYLDGISETAAKPYDPGFTFTSALSIGAWGYTSIHNFYGTVDELAIYNRGLSPAEINLLYSSGSAGKCATPPVFLQPLPNPIVVAGSNTVLNAQVAGSQPMSWQWYFNSLPLADDAHISGSTSTALALSNAQSNHIGDYYLVASNVVTVSTSSIAHVSVGFPPAIQQPPTNQSVADGSNVTFSVVSTGNSPLSYQWRFNGSNLVAGPRIIGVTDSTLSISNLTIADIGNYDVVIANSFGSVTSVVAALFVVTVPPEIVTDPTNRVALYGNTTTFASTVSGRPDLFYRWQKDDVDLGDTDRLSGAQTPALTISNIQVADIGAYRLVASNSHGVAFSAEANLSVVPIAVWGGTNYGEANVPATLTNAIAITAQGYTVEHLNLGLKSDRTVSGWGHYYDGNYMTYFDPTNIPHGLTNVLEVSAAFRHGLALKSDLSVVGFGDNSFGQTTIPSGLGPVVVAGAGSLHSLLLKSDATVAGWGYDVTPPPGISNIVAICPGYFHSLAIRTDGTVLGWGLNWYGEANSPVGLSNVVAVSAGSHHSLALKSDGTVVAWGYDYYGQADVPPGLSNVVAIVGGFSHSLALKSDGTVVAWGAGGTGPAVPPPGLTNVVGIAAGNTHSLALLQSPIAQALPATWWQGSTNRIVLAGQNAVFIPAFSGSSPMTFQWTYNNAPMPGETNRWLAMDSLQPDQSGDYQLVLSNSVGLVTSAVSQVRIGYSPTWVLQPVSQTNITGFATQFVSAATGSAPIAYQWYLNSTPLSNDARHSGTTNATLVISNLLTTDAGNYTVRATNLFGSITSTAASLTILVPPKITSQPLPLSRTVRGRVNVNFSAAATGTSPLRYFWQKNGQAISGATNTLFTLFDVRRTNAGIYSVLVTNSAGFISSSNVTLRVLMAQKFQTPTQSADGSIIYVSQDFDGGLIPDSDLPGFEADGSTNLVNWEPLSNSLVISNGLLRLLDPRQSNYPSRFYRIIEH